MCGFVLFGVRQWNVIHFLRSLEQCQKVEDKFIMVAQEFNCSATPKNMYHTC